MFIQIIIYSIWIVLMSILLSDDGRGVKTQQIHNKIPFRYSKKKQSELMNLIGGLLINSPNIKQLTLHSYKFYSGLLGELLELRKKFGANINSGLSSIREGIAKDLKFEQRFLDALLVALFQYCFIMGVTWVFVFFMHDIQKNLFTAEYFLYLGSFQLLGIILLVLSLLFLKNRLFMSYPPVFYSLYTIRSLYNADLPIGVLIKKAEIGKLNKNSFLKTIVESLETALQKKVKRGENIEADIQSCLDETWYSLDKRHETFKKWQDVLKLVFMAVFILPGYFSVFLQLFKGVV